VSDRLPEYRIKARNTSAGGENAIHDDATAQQYGFRGALVPGVTVYAYLTPPLMSAFGTAWLDRGVTSVRFVKPVMEGEEVVVTGEITERTAQAVTARLSASTAASGECATASVTLPAGLPTAVNLAQYATAALPADRPPATREALLGISVLGSPVYEYTDAEATAYLDKIADSHMIYRGPGGRVHPAFYLHVANRALSRNVKLGPWIHVGSVVRHLAAARIGDTLTMRGRVRSLFEKKGKEFVELDLVMTAGARAIAHILHTAIYRLPAPSTPA
jgi:acyl dehydratase